MTDPERSKGRKKGSTEIRKKGKKVKSDNTVNEQEAPDVLICNGCKGIFINVNAKMICGNRCQKWYCTMHFTAFWQVRKQMILHGFVKLVRNQPRKQS